jgi:alkylation response protein AidB-like acyl-CoA dehydrogenase
MNETSPLANTILQKKSAQIAAAALAPDAERVDREAEWPADGMHALADAGLLGLHIPRHLGGLGEGLLSLAIVTEELGRACSSTAMCFSMHCVASKVLAAKATKYQEDQYLRPIAEGRHITTLALSEPGTGAQNFLPRSHYRVQGDDFVLDGQKSFVTSGSHADSYVVSAVPPGAELDPGTFICLVMDSDSPGIEWLDAWRGLGMRGNSSRAAKLNRVTLPRANLLGVTGDEIWYVFEIIQPYFVIAMAGVYLGIAQAALDLTIARLQSRRHEHTGETLSTISALSDEVAVMWTRTERARQLVHHAARLGDAGAPNAQAALFAAKLDVAEAAVAVTNAAMMLAGGRGYQENSALGRLLRDAQAAHVMSPTTHLLKRWLGRSVLGMPLL